MGKSLMGRSSLVLALLCTAIALLVGGCGKSGSGGSSGGSSAGSAATEEAEAPAPKTNELVISSFGGSWGNAIQKGFIDDFEKQTGIQVKLLSTDEPAKSKLAIESGNNPPEDIVDYDYGTAVSLQKDGLLAPVDYSELDPSIRSQVPSSYLKPYAEGWGGFAIALCYDKQQFAADPPKSWADFWNFSKYPGGRGMVSWPVQPQPEFGLLAAGVPVNKLYPLDIPKAMEQIKALQPHVPKFVESPATLQQQMIDGTTTMSACFANRAAALIASGEENLGIEYNDARLIDDYFMVWKNAPNRANAMKFLAFVLKPEEQAKWAKIGYTVPVNTAALEELPESVSSKLPAPGEAFPSNDTYYTEETEGKTNQELIIEEWNSQIGL